MCVCYVGMSVCVHAGYALNQTTRQQQLNKYKVQGQPNSVLHLTTFWLIDKLCLLSAAKMFQKAYNASRRKCREIVSLADICVQYLQAEFSIFPESQHCQAVSQRNCFAECLIKETVPNVVLHCQHIAIINAKQQIAQMTRHVRVYESVSV